MILPISYYRNSVKSHNRLPISYYRRGDHNPTRKKSVEIRLWVLRGTLGGPGHGVKSSWTKIFQVEISENVQSELVKIVRISQRHRKI